jgi:hypothetical protein
MPIIFPIGACLLLPKSFKTLHLSLLRLVNNQSNIRLECNVVKVLDDGKQEDVAGDYGDRVIWGREIGRSETGID